MKLRPHCHTAIFTAPTFVAAGTVSAGTTSTTPGLPAGQLANDILLYLVSWNDGGGNVTTPTGYTSITLRNGASNRTRAFWKRSIGGGEAAQTCTISLGVNGIIGRMLAFRNCILTGSPIDQSATAEDGGGTALSCPAIIPAFPNSMVINQIGFTAVVGTTTTEFSAEANANLTSVTEAIDNTNSGGAGNGICATYGIAVRSGQSIGSTTATGVTSAQHTYITFNVIGVQS